MSGVTKLLCGRLEEMVLSQPITAFPGMAKIGSVWVACTLRDGTAMLDHVGTLIQVVVQMGGSQLSVLGWSLYEYRGFRQEWIDTLSEGPEHYLEPGPS